MIVFWCMKADSVSKVYWSKLTGQGHLISETRPTFSRFLARHCHAKNILYLYWLRIQRLGTGGVAEERLLAI